MAPHEGLGKAPAFGQLGTDLAVVIAQHLALCINPAGAATDCHVDQAGLFRQGRLDQQLADVVQQGAAGRKKQNRINLSNT